MVRYFVRKKKKTNECDCASAPVDCAQPFIEAPNGIGPVNPMGGPDKFDALINPYAISDKKKKKK